MASRKPTIYWESSVLIAHFQGEKRAPGEMEGVDEVVGQHGRGEIVLATSVLTRVEVLKGRMTPKQRETYEQFMRRDDVVEINAFRRIVNRAAELRETTRLDGLDALHLASALTYGAREFHTFDDKRGKSLLKLADQFKADIKIGKPGSPQMEIFDSSGAPRYPKAAGDTSGREPDGGGEDTDAP